MPSYDTSSRSNMAYAINRRGRAAEVFLVVGCGMVATFIVTYALVATFGYDTSTSLVLSFMSSVVGGVLLSSVYLLGRHESTDRSS